MASGAVAPPPPPLTGARRGFGGRGVLLRRRLAATPMKDEPGVSANGGKDEMVADSVNVARKASLPGLSSSSSNRTTVTPTPLHPVEPSDLRFNRLRPSIEESDCKYKRYFGRYVAREAMIDEEYWIAAWLRAENHYEDQSGDRYVESFKRKYASQGLISLHRIRLAAAVHGRSHFEFPEDGLLNTQQSALDRPFRAAGSGQTIEFHALKKRCGKQFGEKYTCFVAVKNDDIARTVLNSVVGTLDLCVRHPLHGEKYPAEPGNSPFYSRIYQPDQPKFAYLTNVCVAKYARRQGIASNLLLLAIDAARLDGAESIYIHVHKDNLPARRLYDHIGFKMVDMDCARQSSDLCLLSFNKHYAS